MKPVLKQSNPCHYISDADMIRFIELNSDMNWNTVCDYVREKGITSKEGDKVRWDRDDYMCFDNKDAEKWVGGFFKAHPWIDRMYIVFDD